MEESDLIKIKFDAYLRENIDNISRIYFSETESTGELEIEIIKKEDRNNTVLLGFPPDAKDNVYFLLKKYCYGPVLRVPTFNNIGDTKKDVLFPKNRQFSASEERISAFITRINDTLCMLGRITIIDSGGELLTIILEDENIEFFKNAGISETEYNYFKIIAAIKIQDFRNSMVGLKAGAATYRLQYFKDDIKEKYRSLPDDKKLQLQLKYEVVDDL